MKAKHSINRQEYNAQGGLVAIFITLSLLLSSCNPSSLITSVDITETQPKVTEVTPIPPSLTPTFEPTSTITPVPTETLIPTPTMHLLSLEAGQEEAVNKVNELIEKGFDITWEEREDGNLDLFLPSQLENEAEESDERVLLATMEIESGSFKITTAKNEPYSFSPDQIEATDGRLLISDERWGEDPILDFRNNGWDSYDPDRLLFLAAGPDAVYQELPTGLFGLRYPTVALLDVPEEGPITVGLYDTDGMLHSYKMRLEEQEGIERTTGVCFIYHDSAHCEMMGSFEVRRMLAYWLENGTKFQFTIRVTNLDNPTVMQIYDALQEDSGFPQPPEDFELHLAQFDIFYSDVAGFLENR